MSNRLSLRNSTRVKWFPDSELCQVKLFLPEDSPSKIRSRAENHLQAKPCRMLKSGFRGRRSSGTLKRTREKTHIPQQPWTCPPMFILNDDWKVVAGELSEETETQKRREMREPEALYPHPSNIPPSPLISPCGGECDYDDRETPVISLIPIEETVAHESTVCSLPEFLNSVALKEDEIGQNSAQCIAPQESIVVNEKRIVEIPTVLDADIVAAASSAAFTAIMKSNEMGSLIDTDLLIKILQDPKMLERLSKDSGVSGPANPATSSAPIPTNKRHSPMFQKPLNESSHMHKVVQQNVGLASNAFMSSERAQFQTSPLSNAKTLPVTSSQQAEEKSHLFHNGIQFPSNASFSESTATSSLKLQDLTNIQPVLSAAKSNSLSYISSQEPPIGLSSRAGHLSKNYGPNMISSTAKQNQILQPFEIPPARSTLKYSSSLSDGLTVSPDSSGKTRDINYYKSLIKLHGTERKASKEEQTKQYRSRESEVMPVSRHGGARAKIPIRCKFYNSSKGCRNGLSCPFQHDSSLMLQAESRADAGYRGKRMKFSRELS